MAEPAPAPAGRPPVISFLTDFGPDATAPGVCRGVMLGIAPEARIVDLTHAVRPFDVAEGAFLLWTAVPHLPLGVHLAVVDPGVGTERRPVALRAARGDVLVGPDNGLLRPAAERLGGLVEARVLENPALWRHPVSSTFHGRDMFAPVAAHLAAGEPFASVGPVVDVSALVDLRFPEPAHRPGALESAVIFVDRFGNCRLAGDLDDLRRLGGEPDGRRYRLTLPDGPREVPFHRTFGRVEPGEPLLYEDADMAGLGLAVRNGSAAEVLGLAPGAQVEIRPA